ncbi:MAG: sulfite exporter TauE/SafE family protein [Gemmatimonadetes bacterium]|nr:sulfite exporter TauE/SafE family protein [Gemmatimonadota bacterium]MBI3569192.1 sulfite exporter TauE/SafE family protein [Gemmatimonadota bacterium]
MVARDVAARKPSHPAREPPVILVFLAIGLGAGILSGLFGIGGGIVIVPALVFMGRLPLKTAIGTSLGALLLPVGALGLYTYWRAGQLDVKAAAWVALGMVVGVLIGALAAQSLTDALLKKGFALLLVGVAVRLWFSPIN